MNNKLENYKSFFADQVKEAITEQQKINHSSISQLLKSGDLSLCYVESVQQELGIVVL